MSKTAEEILRASLHYESNESYEYLLKFPHKEQIIFAMKVYAEQEIEKYKQSNLSKK